MEIDVRSPTGESNGRKEKVRKSGISTDLRFLARHMWNAPYMIGFTTEFDIPAEKIYKLRCCVS
jgi:hypothetical protein